MAEWIALVALLGIGAAASESDLLQPGTTWKGEIRQGNEAFPATMYLMQRAAELITGEIDFQTQSGLCKLTFAGRVTDKTDVTWTTNKKEGNVTYPGLYSGRVNGNRLSGTWEVPSAGQSDRFSFVLTPNNEAISDATPKERWQTSWDDFAKEVQEYYDHGRRSL